MLAEDHRALLALLVRRERERRHVGREVPAAARDVRLGVALLDGQVLLRARRDLAIRREGDDVVVAARRHERRVRADGRRRERAGRRGDHVRRGGGDEGEAGPRAAPRAPRAHGLAPRRLRRLRRVPAVADEGGAGDVGEHLGRDVPGGARDELERRPRLHHLRALAGGADARVPHVGAHELADGGPRDVRRNLLGLEVAEVRVAQERNVVVDGAVAREREEAADHPVAHRQRVAGDERAGVDVGVVVARPAALGGRREERHAHRAAAGHAGLVHVAQQRRVLVHAAERDVRRRPGELEPRAVPQLPARVGGQGGDRARPTVVRLREEGEDECGARAG